MKAWEWHKRWVWRNGAGISVWNIPTGKTGLPFQTFRFFRKFSIGTTIILICNRIFRKRFGNGKQPTSNIQIVFRCWTRYSLVRTDVLLHCCTCQPNEFNIVFQTWGQRKCWIVLDRKFDGTKFCSTAFSIIQHHSAGWPNTYSMLDSTVLDNVGWNVGSVCPWPYNQAKCAKNVWTISTK